MNGENMKSILLPEPLHRQLKLLAYTHGLSLRAALQEALSVWIEVRGEQAPASAVPVRKEP
jgi:hypothetical protein